MLIVVLTCLGMVYITTNSEADTSTLPTLDETATVPIRTPVGPTAVPSVLPVETVAIDPTTTTDFTTDHLSPANIPDHQSVR